MFSFWLQPLRGPDADLKTVQNQRLALFNGKLYISLADCRWYDVYCQQFGQDISPSSLHPAIHTGDAQNSRLRGRVIQVVAFR